MKQIRLSLLAVCFATVCYGQSQGAQGGASLPASTQAKKEQDRDASAILQRGTESAPVVVRLIVGDEEKKYADRNEKQAAEAQSINRTQMWFNFGLLIVAAFQFTWAFRQLPTNKTQLRAWVTFDVHFSGKVATGERVAMEIVCFNHGPTPAVDLGHRGKLWFQEYPIPEGFQDNVLPNEWNEGRTVVFPSRENGLTEYINCTFGEWLTAQQIAQFKSGGYSILVGIEIKYLDAFRRRHTTTKYLTFTWKTLNEKWQLVPEIYPGGSHVT